jgi:hypothetical protein
MTSYEAPEITDLGTVEAVTAGRNSGVFDSLFGSDGGARGSWDDWGASN